MDILNALIVTLLFLLMINYCQGLGDNKKVKNCCSPCRCSFSKRRIITVDCSDRNLTEVPHCSWSNVRKLILRGNRIRDIPSAVFENMSNIRILDLSKNELGHLPKLNVTMYYLRELNLEHNNFRAIPRSALSKMPKLKNLILSFNYIEELPRNSFRNLGKLRDLLLNENNLTKIDPEFMGNSGNKLILLDLSWTKLKHIPFESIRKLRNLKMLELRSTDLEEIPDFAFKGLKNLEFIDLHDTRKLNKIGTKAFTYMPKLHTLSLLRHGLKQFPNLTGTDSVMSLELQENKIEEIPENVCDNLEMLQTLSMSMNKLKRLPKLTNCKMLTILLFDHNSIGSIGDSLHGLKDLMDLSMKGNKIQRIEADDFKGLGKLEYLNLNDNSITNIHDEAFSSFKKLYRIFLKNSKFAKLPTKGLQTVRNLSIKGNTRLMHFPSPMYFPCIEELQVQYPYHCCSFRKIAVVDTYSNIQITSWTWLNKENASSSTEEPIIEPVNNSYEGPTTESIGRKQFKCEPEADPFFPCDELMGDWLLRCGVWVVFLLALTGNATVIIVILASHTKMDVSRFLISNLAFADLFMGIYLGFLAVVDVSTLGNFQKYALDWQMSAGCQTAGFLAVLSSELSVFTLTVITLERYIAIKNAIRVNRKLELKTAMIVMAIGWLFAIVTATLPLMDINSYGKISVCLPFEIGNTQSIVFITFLLCLNATAFVVILCCYVLMYCSIRGSNAWNASDFRVAKRMALLVFTDFACWAPIVFMSLTAAFGSTFLSLNQAKIFTVFVFPLNSCANPFLYAIFTSHFKKDILNLCRRVEDKYPFLKINKQKISFSRRSSYSGAISENANVYIRSRRFSLPIFMRGLHNSITTHDKAGSSASSNSNNKNSEMNALVHQNGKEVAERETCV